MEGEAHSSISVKISGKSSKAQKQKSVQIENESVQRAN
jgi:hypothetical protein